MAFSCKKDNSLNPEPDPVMQLTYPRGGETFFIGDTVVIKWKCKEGALSSLGVYLFVGKVDSKYVINHHSYGPNDSCKWIIANESGLPGNGFPSDSVQIMIDDYDDQPYSDRTGYIRIRNRE